MLLEQEAGDPHQVAVVFMDLDAGAPVALRLQKRATRPVHVNHIPWPAWCTGIFIGMKEADEEIGLTPTAAAGLHTLHNHTMFRHRGFPARQQDPLFPQVDLDLVAGLLALTRQAAPAAVAVAGQ